MEKKIKNSYQILVKTQSGNDIQVEVTHKKVKNFNIRISAQGVAKASIPYFSSRAKAKEFIFSKAQWIEESVKTQLNKPQYVVPQIPKQQAEQVLNPIVLQTFIAFKDILKNNMPTIKYRSMKTRWGVCYPAKNTITLNTQLVAFPLEAQQYVVLHEFVHFIHPHHQKPFHDTMRKLMPDYKERKKLLKR